MLQTKYDEDFFISFGIDYKVFTVKKTTVTSNKLLFANFCSDVK